jgi:RNA polymerase-interacting CarD/CdnL/TRCF family regulator
MDTYTTYYIGETVVYAMHGIGRVSDIITRTVEGPPQRFYQITLDSRCGGEVLVPVDGARDLGLRRVLQASEVAQVLQQLQRPASQLLERGQGTRYYAWCKERIQQGDACGLAEVRRLLHDLAQIERITNIHLKRMRDYVSAQLPTEIAHAWQCPHAAAERLVTCALALQRPPAVPSPSGG